MRTALLPLLLLACAALTAAAPSSKGSGAPDCPPKRPRTHCVYLELSRPTPREAEKVVRLLRADGVEASVQEETSDVSATLSDTRLRKLLGARVVYNATGAGASDLIICEASIDSIKPPARYKNVKAARIDPACP